MQLISSSYSFFVLWNQVGTNICRLKVNFLLYTFFFFLCSFFVAYLLQADLDTPVLAAGDPERMNMKKCEDMGGIPYHINVVKYMVKAKKWGCSHASLNCSG